MVFGIKNSFQLKFSGFQKKKNSSNVNLLFDALFATLFGR